jgi:hypothetical protein
MVKAYLISKEILSMAKRLAKKKLKSYQEIKVYPWSIKVLPRSKGLSMKYKGFAKK